VTKPSQTSRYFSVVGGKNGSVSQQCLPASLLRLESGNTHSAVVFSWKLNSSLQFAFVVFCWKTFQSLLKEKGFPSRFVIILGDVRHV